MRTLSLGTALLSLFSGGGELPKHGEDAVTIGNLAHRGCVVTLWTKWRKGILWSFLNSSKFKVVWASWELWKPTGLTALLCSVLEGAFGNQMGSTAQGNWVSVCCGSCCLLQSAVIQRSFLSQYPTDRSLAALSLSFTIPLVCGYQVKWCGLGIVTLTYPDRVKLLSRTGNYFEFDLQTTLQKDKLLLAP